MSRTTRSGGRSTTRKSSNRGQGPAGRGPGTAAWKPAPSNVGRPLALRLPYVAAIGLSAVLLFSLELWAGRRVLPVCGGTPGVWTTTLCFFTGILFLGYLYAHLVAVRLAPRTGALVQLGIALLAVVLVLVAPADVSVLRVDGMPDAINVLLVLVVVAGAAGFLLSTTTPLLSAWFGGRGDDPWWLYAASNGASFLALLAYPFVVEPLLGLTAQRYGLVAGLVGYAVALAWIARGAGRTASPATATATASEATPTRRRMAVWLAAAAVPAGLLSATTNVLQTDLVAAPFIWVGPLAVYLLSFVVAFSARGRRALPWVDRLVPAAAALLWIPFIHPAGWLPAAILLVELASFLVIAIAVHGRLAMDRPDPAHLTRFYLVLSGGGVLATAFVALLSPVLFPAFYEYPILIVLGLAMLAVLEGKRGAWLPDRSHPAHELVALAWRLVPFGVVAAVLLATMGSEPLTVGYIAIPVAVGAIAVAIGGSARILALATPIAIVIAFIGSAPSADTVRTIYQGRTFFGELAVLETSLLHAEVSGTTLHGVEFTDGRAMGPTTYFASSGPLGDVFSDLRTRASSPTIGVVGLGAGTTAAYAKPGDSMTFYEIDEAVVRLAYDPAYFTYLRDAAAPPQVVVGDGRLSLRAVAPGTYDLLILDAFTSDAVPPHLLTVEAIQTYMRTLKPGGVVAFNVSNRYYDLAPLVGATAHAAGFDAVTRSYLPDAAHTQSEGATSSTWVIVGSAADLARFTATGWLPLGPGGPVLTDDYPDLLRSLRAFGG